MSVGTYMFYSLSTTNTMDMDLSKLWEMAETEEPGVLQSMGHTELDTT